MQNKVCRLGPVALGTAVANVFNPPTLTGGTNPPASSTSSYYILRHIRALNKTTSSATCSFWIGATGASAAGTEFLGTSLPVAANSYVDWFGVLRLDTADFVTAQASAATTITVEAEGEIGVN